MNLDEIITAAVEKRVSEIVDLSIHARPVWEYEKDWRPTQIEVAVGKAIDKIAQEEVKKHEEPIRAAIQEALRGNPSSFEVSAYTKIKLPSQ